MLTSGGFSNAANFSWFVEKLSFISPNRYCLEAFFRRMSYHVNDEARERILESLGFTLGDFACYAGLILFTIIFFMMGQFVIYWRNRKFV